MKHGLRATLLLLLAASSQVLAADPAPASKPASECKLRPVRVLNPDHYYPSAERAAGHAGLIVVEFAVMTSPGKPVDLRVVTSSSYPALDAAAIQITADTTFKTLCPGERAKIAVKFG